MCSKLGVELADFTDPDKTFSPRTDGQVLGINYDSSIMSWYLREDKMGVIIGLIEEALIHREVTARFAKKMCGKLINLRELIKGSKFHLAQIIITTSIVNRKEDMEKLVAFTHINI